jgi:hypothetical protein
MKFRVFLLFAFGSTMGHAAQLAFGQNPKITEAFKLKVVRVSEALGISPDDLMTTMAIETSRPLPGGGVEETFDPAIKAGTSSAVGLIQFLPRTAAGLGTTVDALAAMSGVEQLDYVQKYLTDYRGRMRSTEDVYFAVFYPPFLGAQNTAALPDHLYTPNKGLDKDGDGRVTRGEVGAFVKRKLEKGRLLRG